MRDLVGDAKSHHLVYQGGHQVSSGTVCPALVLESSSLSSMWAWALHCEIRVWMCSWGAASRLGITGDSCSSQTRQGCPYASWKQQLCLEKAKGHGFELECICLKGKTWKAFGVFFFRAIRTWKYILCRSTNLNQSCGCTAWTTSVTCGR